jgi:hypothetical protein
MALPSLLGMHLRRLQSLQLPTPAPDYIMITKYDQYWHLYFLEECEDTPQAILITVQKLFEEMSQMGDIHFVRAGPEIIREKLFGGGTRTAVYCRFSSITPDNTSSEESRLIGFGFKG